MLLLEALPCRLVTGFDRRQAVEQLARPGIAGPLRRALVEIARFHLHARRFVADPLEAEILDQPDGAAVVEASYVLPADQRDGLAEAAAVLFDERSTVAVFLDGHLVEDPGGLRIVGAQALRVPPVDAPVVFLRGDRKGEHLLLRQVLELPPLTKARDHRVAPEVPGRSERLSLAQQP